MCREILIYSLLFVCLLTKDGISYAFDVLKEKVEISSLNDIEMEDSMEEEGSTEDWLNHASLVNLVPKLLIEISNKNSFPDRNEAELQVLLELVSPPPRMA
jgi:hypothetical protein